jgi:hypothetical protein
VIGTRTANKIILRPPPKDKDGKDAKASGAKAAATGKPGGPEHPNKAYAGLRGGLIVPIWGWLELILVTFGTCRGFELLDADAVLENLSTIKSMCMNCHSEEGRVASDPSALLLSLFFFTECCLLLLGCERGRRNQSAADPHPLLPVRLFPISLFNGFHIFFLYVTFTDPPL